MPITGHALPGPIPEWAPRAASDVYEGTTMSTHPDSSEELEPTAASGVVPVLAVVGRPNVGKSTLVNRSTGRREAVVQDIPGVPRDRASYDATCSGRAFTGDDAGGCGPDARGLAERI